MGWIARGDGGEGQGTYPAVMDTLRSRAGDPCVLACVGATRRLASFDAVRVGVIPGIFHVCSGPAGEVPMESERAVWKCDGDSR